MSGDTPCADHEVAKRIRGMSALVPPGGNMVDDITYAVAEPASVFTHPLCRNTWRNGQKIGEPAAHPAYNVGTLSDTLPVMPALPSADTTSP